MRADVSLIVSTHGRQNLFFYVNTNDNIYFQLWLRALFVDRLTKLNSIKDALICVSTHDVVWLAIAHTIVSRHGSCLIIPRPQLGSGKAGPEGWAERVRLHATAAAGSMSPVGQHILGTLMPAPAARVSDETATEAREGAVEC